MKINDNVIQELLLPFRESGEPSPYYCYGVITGTVGQLVLLGALASLANKYFILGFSDRKITMIQLNMMGKVAGSSTIPYDQIKKVKIGNWFFGMGKKVVVELQNNAKIKFKINKHTMGITKQSENLINICELLTKRFQ